MLEPKSDNIPQFALRDGLEQKHHDERMNEPYFPPVVNAVPQPPQHRD